MKIVIEKELEGFWVTPAEARDLNDKELIEIANEDICALLDGAAWKVIRNDDERYGEDQRHKKST